MGRHSIVAAALGLLALVGLATRYEARASWLQARYFTRQASQLTNEIGEGPSDRIRFPGDGPYDRRFGYARLPAALQTAAARGYRIAAQVRVSERFAELVDRGLSPIFPEKTQAGLRILDRRGATIFESRYPERIYPSVDSVPPAVWQTLLFLENRALLDPRFPNHNPSVDWPRMAKAAADFALSWLGSRRSVPGASTLATQLEKFRHSTEGRTRSTREKLLQMEAASLRSYLGGENTEAARRRIVADYLNSVPLAAIAGHGEVTGLGDGLWAWYGADPDEVNRVLWEEARGGTASDSGAVAQRAVAYRQVLSLMLAQRRPSYLLLQPEGRAELRERTDQHLRLVAREGIISAQLRDAALAVDLTPRSRAPDVPRVSFIERKGANAVRAELLGLTGVSTLYELDRFDLTARTTLDLPVQEAVTHLLVQLTDRAFVRKQGLASVGLLDRGDPARHLRRRAARAHGGRQPRPRPGGQLRFAVQCDRGQQARARLYGQAAHPDQLPGDRGGALPPARGPASCESPCGAGRRRRRDHRLDPGVPGRQPGRLARADPAGRDVAPLLGQPR